MDFLAGIMDNIPDLFTDLIGTGLSSGSNKSKYDKAMSQSSAETVPLNLGQVRTASAGKSTDTNPNKFANYDQIQNQWMDRLFTFYNMNKIVGQSEVKGPTRG